MVKVVGGSRGSLAFVVKWNCGMEEVEYESCESTGVSLLVDAESRPKRRYLPHTFHPVTIGTHPLITTRGDISTSI